MHTTSKIKIKLTTVFKNSKGIFAFINHNIINQPIQSLIYIFVW